MNISKFFRETGGLISDSVTDFQANNVMKLSGSLAYSTIFAMGPLLVVIISLCGIFLGYDAVTGKIYASLSGFLGSDAAAQLQDIIRKAAISNKSKIAMLIGLITLLLGATSVFSEIQDSINMIWGIRPKPRKGWLKMLQNRFLSFSVITGLAFVLLVSLAVTSFVDGFNGRLQHYFAEGAVVLFYIANQLITLAVITSIFVVIFKVLPDAHIRFRDVVVGALVTGILFMLGKLGISFYISHTHVGSTYGAAGSLVVVLLWVYYSSLILYFGAEFTKAYAIKYGSEIRPNSYAVTVKQVEVETGKTSVQEKENTVDATMKLMPGNIHRGA